jgi:hypothetical protein
VKIIRAEVQHNPNWVEYVEKNIHAKRHMFANHLLKHYVGNLERQGNAPAEANHSSILQRLGNAFYESPVMLIQALMKRHQDLTAERHYVITKYRLETSAEAWNSRPGTEKEELLSLGIWGMELYRSAVLDSVRLNMIQLSNGKRAFMNKDDPGQIVLVSLDPNSTACYCRFWIAYNCQCPHLLLLRNGFCRDLWAERWLQAPHLQSSVQRKRKLRWKYFESMHLHSK